MADNTVQFNINIAGNAQAAIAGITNMFGNLTASAQQAISPFKKLGDAMLRFNAVTDYLENFSDALNNAIAPGVSFDASLRELSAVTGETGEGLKLIGEYARENAKAFGGQASDSLKSYQLLLSQLTPEIAKSPEALKAMGESVSVLSKSMGGDATAAAETLSTAMNQYGISLENPIKASEEMSKMMNVMSAAAGVGSAELPQIKQALEQAGMSAKLAGISFEETNAAIQVLDKAGKKGSEGGIALRNVMSTLSQGRFLPKDVQKELSAAGVSISDLTNKNLTLEERLKKLNPIMNDTALLSKLFGRENAASALALLNNTEMLQEYTSAVSGTNAAYEYAETVMESYEQRQARIQAQFDDMKISLFNATGDLGIWAGTVTSALIPMAQLVPLVWGLIRGFAFLQGMKLGGIFIGLSQSVRLLNWELAAGNLAAFGFGQKMLQAAIATVRFATVGIFNAIKGIGALILSLITGGATAVTFSGIASTAFGAFATAATVACRAISVAIFAIPIIGWIALAITAIAGLFIWLYNKFDKFRAFLNGIGAAIKAFFTGEDVSDAYDRAYNETMEEAGKRLEAEKKDDPLEQIKQMEDELKNQEDTTSGVGATDLNGALSNTGSKAAGENRIKNVYIDIEKVVEKFTVQTTTLKESKQQIRDMVSEALIEAVNDVNLAF
jgi:TP901 family phage tail tape measure protein